MRPDVRFNALPWYRRALWYLEHWIDGAIGEINALAKRFHDSQEVD